MIQLNFLNQIHYVYETMNEFRSSKDKNKLKPFRVADVGDYVLSDNGYYIPVTRIHDYVKTMPDKRKLQYRRIVFPYYSYYYSKASDIVRPMIYRRHKVMPGCVMPLGYQSLAVIKLIKSGYSLSNAIRHIFPNKYFLRLIRLMSNPLFVKQLENIAMSLKDEISSQGINHAYIAKKLKDILEAEKPNSTLTKYALETSINILQQVNPNLATPVEGKSLVNEIRKEMSSSMIN